MQIDGVIAEEIYKITVIDAGTPPPLEINTNKKNSSKKKIKQFVAKSSAGLRIRVHPTTQSAVVGTIKVPNAVSFIDEVDLLHIFQ
jgi:RCR-type E3 ubiquitin transferase